MKSEKQRAKEVAKVEDYLRLLYNEGLSKSEAAKQMEMSPAGLERLRKRYVPNDFETTLKESGFDPHTWDHGWLKVEGSSIHVRNKEGIVTYDDIRDEMIRAMDAHAPRYPKLVRPKVEDGHLLIVSPTDIHIGRYSSLSETGRHYDVEVAKKQASESLQGLLSKTSGFSLAAMTS